MKRTSKILLIPLVAFLMQGTLKSQTDSFSVNDSYLSEVRNSKVNRFFQMDKEEKFMIKLGAEGFFLPDHYFPGFENSIYIGLEIKIKPYLSLLNSYNYNLEDVRYGGAMAMNYYFDISQRIFEGRSANNFSADYLKIEFQNFISKYSYDPKLGSVTENVYLPFMTFGYGIQRRLSTFAFIDFSAYCRYGLKYQQFDFINLSLKVGFTLPILKKYGKN